MTKCVWSGGMEWGEGGGLKPTFYVGSALQILGRQ